MEDINIIKMNDKNIIKMTDEYDDYLSDESKIKGNAKSISFPESESNIKEILKCCKESQTPITIQGNLTGISGGAVPKEGHILNLSKMNKIIGMSYDKNSTFSIKVEPGVLLEDLNYCIKTKRFDTSSWSLESKKAYELFIKSQGKLFPPDPTETLASIGGMVSCNASGACSYYYGSTRNYIKSLKVITPSDEFYIERGLNKLEDIYNSEGYVYNIKKIKNAAGYYLKEDMDLIDLFIGSEGTLGIISEVEINLIDDPKCKFGVLLFFSDLEYPLEFVKWLRKETQNKTKEFNYSPVAIEYFNKDAFDIINRYRNIKTEIKDFKSVNSEVLAGVYVEFHEDSEDEVYDILEELMVGAKVFNVNEDTEWLALDEVDYIKLKRFRHLVAECVNISIDEIRKIDSKVKKIGTDMAVSDCYLSKIMKMYESDLAKSNLKSVIFGHIGNNHLHVNIIAKSTSEYNEGLELVNKWAEQVISYGGTISAEHGVGILKKELFKKMFSYEEILEMKRIKQFFDDQIILNRALF